MKAEMIRYDDGTHIIHVEDICILEYRLIRTTRRITFDIQYQRFAYQGEDDGNYWRFIASNGYEIISRSRMDIQTERIWLKGGCHDERSIRSGTMTFSSQETCDSAYRSFNSALLEWCRYQYKQHL